MEEFKQTSYRNRRSAMRRIPRGTVKFECRKGAMGLGPNLAVDIGNLSETGISIYLKIPLDKKQEVEILMQGHGVANLKRLGNVVWCREVEKDKYFVGIHFQKVVAYAEIMKISKPLS